MDPLIIVALVVIAVVAVGAIALKRNKELPEGDAHSEGPKGLLKTEPTGEGAGEISGGPAPVDAPLASDEPQAGEDGGAAPALSELQPDAPGGDPARTEPDPEQVEALKKGLASTRGGFISRLARIFGKKPEIDPALLDEIEEILLTADIGVKTSQRILEQLRSRLDRGELAEEEQVWEALRDEARTIFGSGHGGLRLNDEAPQVILVVGVNGVGKTTTIGKLASRLVENDKKVVLAAGDTFRAAAVLQLEVWGRRVGCEVVKGKERADPGSVIFEAVQKGREIGADVVIADTAGRLHTKAPLMEELKKVGRTAEKALGRPVDEILLVLDSTTGQNAIQQAELFKDALPVSGIVLTKLDGTAKGGVILGIVAEHKVPVRFIGIGERVEDLKEFDAPSFIRALFEKPDDASIAA